MIEKEITVSFYNDESNSGLTVYTNTGEHYISKGSQATIKVCGIIGIFIDGGMPAVRSNDNSINDGFPRFGEINYYAISNTLTDIDVIYMGS